jgi:hypothetical protein
MDLLSRDLSDILLFALPIILIGLDVLCGIGYLFVRCNLMLSTRSY